MLSIFQAVVLEKTLESPLDSKEIKPVNPKGKQFWIFTGRTDAEAPILCPLDAKNQFTGKDPDTGKDWGQKEKRVTEDEMAGWHHWFNGHEFEQTLWDSEGQGSSVCCSPCGYKSQTQLNDWTKTTLVFRTSEYMLFPPPVPFPILLKYKSWAPWFLPVLSSVQFSHSIGSESLRPHGLQHTRLPLSLGYYHHTSLFV